jgi:hypothetical protein
MGVFGAKVGPKGQTGSSKLLCPPLLAQYAQKCPQSRRSQVTPHSISGQYLKTLSKSFVFDFFDCKVFFVFALLQSGLPGYGMA